MAIRFPNPHRTLGQRQEHLAQLSAVIDASYPEDSSVESLYTVCDAVRRGWVDVPSDVVFGDDPINTKRGVFQTTFGEHNLPQGIRDAYLDLPLTVQYREQDVPAQISGMIAGVPGGQRFAFKNLNVVRAQLLAQDIVRNGRYEEDADRVTFYVPPTGSIILYRGGNKHGWHSLRFDGIPSYGAFLEEPVDDTGVLHRGEWHFQAYDPSRVPEEGYLSYDGNDRNFEGFLEGIYVNHNGHVRPPQKMDRTLLMQMKHLDMQSITALLVAKMWHRSVGNRMNTPFHTFKQPAVDIAVDLMDNMVLVDEDGKQSVPGLREMERVFNLQLAYTNFVPFDSE